MESLAVSAISESVIANGDRGKKNLYYTAAESINNLVSALKYITR
jgi:hypothetical protein